MSTNTNFNVGDKVRYVGTHSGHNEIPHPIYYHDKLLEKRDELVVDKVIRYSEDYLYFEVSFSYPRKDLCVTEDGKSYIIFYGSDFELVNSRSESLNSCICDTFSVLMVKGCQCGYLASQRSAKQILRPDDVPF